MKRAARIVLAALFALFIVAVLTFASRAYGQTTPPPDWSCIPAQHARAGDVRVGTRYEVFETAVISGRVGWCPTVDGTAWYTWSHQWCRKDLCNKLPASATTTILAALDRIANATDRRAQINIEWKTWGVPPKTPLEDWERKSWRQQACQWLTSTQPGVAPRPPLPIPLPKKLPTDVAFDPPMTFCDFLDPGAKPVPPAQLWKSIGGLIYTTSNGTQLTGVTSRKTAAELACNDAIAAIKVGVRTFYPLATGGGAANERVECAQR